MPISFKNVGKTVIQKQEQADAIIQQSVPYGFLTPLKLGSDTDGIFAMSTSLDEQISDNLRNLLQTNHGERLGLPGLGANLRPLALEYTNSDSFDAIAVERIKMAVSKWMPYIDLQTFSSSVISGNRGNRVTAVNITIGYGIPSLRVQDRQITVTIYVT
jgi:phage baseplate assembly protein W